MSETANRLRVCIVHTGRATPEMLLGGGVERSGGAELQLAAIARGLAARGWPVSFAFYRYGDDRPPDVADGIELVSLTPPEGGLPGLRFLTGTLPRTRALLSKTTADVYIQMGVGWQNALLTQWCRQKHRRFVLWMASITDPVCDDPKHSRLPLHERLLARYGLRNADILIAQTQEQQVALKQRHGRDSILIRNLYAPAKEMQPPSDDPPKVLWAATIRSLKRPHLFLDVAEAIPEMHFLMAGGPADDDDGLFDEVRHRAEAMANVSFLGFVPYREIDDYYRQASVYLCTSTIEGFPNSILQSWHHGRPVVSTFDPDDVIKKHELGFHCAELQEIVAAVREACRSSFEYAPRARKYLEENHSPEVILPQIEATLQGGCQ